MAGVTYLQAKPKPCTTLQVTVLRGRKITDGWWDYISKPDPYVTLEIPNAAEKMRKTKTVPNSTSPEWNQTFGFHYDPSVNPTNFLRFRLWDSNYGWDDKIGGQLSIPLDDLPQGKPVLQTVRLGKNRCEVDLRLQASQENTTDLRFSLELCEEEKTFLQQRKTIVFEAMKKLLGDRAPKTLNEVPTVAVLGSGGGYRAMTGYCGGAKALEDMKVLDCVTYIAGLSGSAWYVSTLYSNDNGSTIKTSDTLSHIRDRLGHTILAELLPRKFVGYDVEVKNKEKSGQPISLTDYYGYVIGDALLGKAADSARFTQQRLKVKDGHSPLPICTSLHVKEDVNAQIFSDWVEYTPYETGIAKYGTFVKSELFGSKFFCGKLIRKYPESHLHYLQGIWGSAYSILLQRLLTGNKNPEEIKNEIKGDGREEMTRLLHSHHNWSSEEDDDEYEPEDEEDGAEDEEDGAADKTDESEPPAKRPVIEENCAKSSDKEGLWKRFGSWIVSEIPFLNTRKGRAGIILNFMRGLELTASNESTQDPNLVEEKETMEKKQIELVDAGLDFNSPYPPLLRPQRAVDLFLSYEFSARDKDEDLPFKELERAAEWAKKNNVRFPPINAEEQFKKEGWKECYVFKNPSDPACPIVLHFVLINKTYRDFIKPGVPRVTPEQKEQGNFKIFDDPKKNYSTFNFDYSNKVFSRLAGLVEFNTALNEETIKSAMADCVENLRKRSK